MAEIWIDVDADVTLPVNIMPLIDDTNFKDREVSITYDQAGLELIWNFETTAGVQTHVAITPTDTGGAYDWVNVGHGMYNIELPATGAGAKNDTEGFGWFTGVATGVLPWRSPVFGFRAAAVNNDLIDAGMALAKSTDLAVVDTVADNIYADMADVTDITVPLGVVDGLVDTLETRLTAARAGYLDKLNVSGTLAHSNDADTYKADVSAITGAALSASGIDAILDEVVVGSYTMRQLLAVMGAALAGKVTGGGTTAITFRGINDASDVIVATVDANGNRSAVTVTV